LQSAGNGNVSDSVSVSISNLAPLTKYYFRLNAQNQYGTINGAIMSFTTSGPSNPGKPSADSNSASKVSNTTATLNGKVGTGGADSTYWFEFSQDSLLGNVAGVATPTSAISAASTPSQVSADITNLSRHTKYFFRLVVKNQYGTATGDQLSFTTK
jgi:phosphodiesterase/alkaline phosphatase D-like protein